jgi:hypothetical protein
VQLDADEREIDAAFEQTIATLVSTSVSAMNSKRRMYGCDRGRGANVTPG